MNNLGVFGFIIEYYIQGALVFGILCIICQLMKFIIMIALNILKLKVWGGNISAHFIIINYFLLIKHSNIIWIQIILQHEYCSIINKYLLNTRVAWRIFFVSWSNLGLRREASSSCVTCVFSLLNIEFQKYIISTNVIQGYYVLICI